jgi:16S rRNA (guanine(966)-N(2))-methyltransferase RsmD
LRIVSGKHKGRRIVAPKNLPVRPTTDMAKEALFNRLANQLYLQDIQALDLYSGTGNISYELSSRGCSQITAVDSFPGCVQFIQKTAAQLDMSISAVRADVFEFLNKTPQKFGFIFADPPYADSTESLAELHAIIFERQLLIPGGLFVLEYEKHKSLTHLPGFVDARTYGSSVFGFFVHQQEEV